MAVHYSNKIVRDGLVLMLDAENEKSFRGIPAVNCAKPLIEWEFGSNLDRTITEVLDGSILPQRLGARIFKVVLNSTISNNRTSNYYSGGGFSGTAINPLILGKTTPNFTTVGSSIGSAKYRFGFWVRGKMSNSNCNVAIDIGDKNYVETTINNNINWQFISTNDSDGIASIDYPYDFFDIFFSGSIGDTFYISDLMIARSIGDVDNLPTLDSYPKFIDYQQTRGYTIDTGGGFVDLSGKDHHHQLTNNLNYTLNPSKITLNGTNGFIYNSSLTTSSLCTVVIFYKTTDNQELWVKGNQSSSYYLAAALTNSNYYQENAGNPVYYVDLNVTTDPIASGYKNGNYHMWEAKNVNFSTWSYFEWFLYGGDWNLNGDVSMILVYDKPLSASESIQNYNLLRKKFNI